MAALAAGCGPGSVAGLFEPPAPTSATTVQVVVVPEAAPLPAAPTAVVPPHTLHPQESPVAAGDQDLLTLGTGEVGVHLLSVDNAEHAERAWRALQAGHPDLLGGLERRIAAHDLGDGRGLHYRVKAGPLPDQASAAALCGRLRARGVFCQVGDFIGN